MARLMDGKKMAASWTRRLRGQFKGVGKLVAVMVGNDPSSSLYLQKKAEMAKALRAQFELRQFPASISQAAVLNCITKLNADKGVVGIIVQLPLPSKFDTSQIVNSIAPHKDIDGLTDANIGTSQMLPATAVGILKLLTTYKVQLRGQKIVLVGFTRLLNIPLSVHLSQLGNVVTVLQKGTRDKIVLREADIIITATGQPRLVRGADVKLGAVVIDAGTTRVGKKVVGDVDWTSVVRRAKLVTPVPGGVGPMTVVALFANLKSAAKSGS